MGHQQRPPWVPVWHATYVIPTVARKGRETTRQTKSCDSVLLGSDPKYAFITQSLI